MINFYLCLVHLCTDLTVPGTAFHGMCGQLIDELSVTREEMNGLSMDVAAKYSVPARQAIATLEILLIHLPLISGCPVQ